MVDEKDRAALATMLTVAVLVIVVLLAGSLTLGASIRIVRLIGGI